MGKLLYKRTEECYHREYMLEAGKPVDLDAYRARRRARFNGEVDEMTTPKDLHGGREASLNHPAVAAQEVDRDLEAIQTAVGCELDPEKLARELEGLFRTLCEVNRQGVKIEIVWPDDREGISLNRAVDGIVERSRKQE